MKESVKEAGSDQAVTETTDYEYNGLDQLTASVTVKGDDKENPLHKKDGLSKEVRQVIEKEE